MEENNLYTRILYDIKFAKRFRRKSIGIFRDEDIKPLDKLSTMFPKFNKDYTQEDGKSFILELCNSKERWYYNSASAYNYFIQLSLLKDNNVLIKKVIDYTNEGDE